jgi:hypothetical protein
MTNIANKLRYSCYGMNTANGSHICTYHVVVVSLDLCVNRRVTASVAIEHTAESDGPSGLARLFAGDAASCLHAHRLTHQQAEEKKHTQRQGKIDHH